MRRAVLGVLVCALPLAPSAPVVHASEPATVDAPARAGDAVIVDPDDPAKQVVSGGSTTEFTIRLPDGAACPGDSANDQWRVQTFLVPASDDPGQLRYGEVGPDGDGRWSVYDVDTRPYIHGLTEPNALAGSPGRISALPVFSFAVFPPGILPPGDYRVGVACTLMRQTAVYWDTALTLSADAADEPAQLTWRLTSAPASASTNSNGSGVVLIVVLAAAAALATVAVVLWRRSHRSLQLAKEIS